MHGREIDGIWFLPRGPKSKTEEVILCCWGLTLSGALASAARETKAMQKLTFHKEWVLLPLRLMIGFGFAAHGYAKLSRGPQSFGVVLQTIGIPQPHLVAWVTALIEFVGGIGLMAGVFVVPLTMPLAVIMLTAMLTVHLQYGFSSIRLTGISGAGAEFGPIGYEMNLLYITGLLTLALSGPTKLSLDHWLQTRNQASRKR